MRVIRACRELGIPSVAVYSDVDRAALHVLKADEAYSIGPAAAAESYLNIDKILAVAKRCGADAIHPGYGFLSENAKFAQACADAGIKFIGPSAASMEMMGSKTRARQEMEKAGVPFVPGTSHGVESVPAGQGGSGEDRLSRDAESGGGRRRQGHAPGTDPARAAIRAGSGAERGAAGLWRRRSLPGESHPQPPAHRDAGAGGRARQHRLSGRTRVFHPAPSSEGAGRGALAVVDAEMRRRMGEVAVRVAQAAGYTNAGTVEFLVDPTGDQKNFLFPRNEHAPASRASGDRTGHRTGPGAPADSHRGGREASVHAGRHSSSADTPSSAASTPKIRTTISSPARARSRR